MPMTVNGIGTMYYGKSSLQQHRGVCAHCHRETVLSTYDTTVYFTFAFIPLIPLGKKHIVEYCSACSKHYAIPLAKWRQTLSNTLSESMARWRQAPQDANAAADAIDALSLNNDKDGFYELAKDVIPRHPANAELLARIGGVCHRFEMNEEACKILARSLELADKEETHEALAAVYLDMLKPDEAARHLGHVVESGQAGKVILLMLLAQCYQAVGRHDKALEVLDAAAPLNPAKSPYKTLYRKLRKTSQKHRLSGGPIRNQFSSPVRAKAAPSWNVGGRVARVAGPAVVLFFVGLYLVGAYVKGRSRDIHLANGLTRPYTVVVNGQNHTLAPLGIKRITIGEGDLRLTVAEDDMDIPDRTVTVRTPFFTRPFIKKTFVVNPDRTAVLYWQKTYYAERPEDAPEGEAKVFVGEYVYAFDRIDFPFQAFPPEINIGDRKSLAKTRLSLLTDNGVYPVQIPSILADALGEQAAVDYLKRRLACEPQDETAVYLLSGLTRPEQFIEIIRPGLAVRPVRVEWHRAYQTIMERTQSGYDLEAEYRRLLEKEPDNSTLQYLLGRTYRDYQQADAYFRQSVAGPDPCAHGYNAMAYQRLCDGRFDEALENARRAMAIEPEDLKFRNMYHSALQATGNHAELLEQYRAALAKEPDNFSWLKEEVCLLAACGRPAEAKTRLNNWLSRYGGNSDPEFRKALENSMHVEFAYASNDLDEYARLAPACSSPVERFAYSITCGRPVEPNSLDQVKTENPYALLLPYMSQHLAGDTEAAERYLLNAVETLDALGYEDRLVAQALSGPDEPVAVRICELAILPRQKAIALTALGLRYPAQRQQYFALAGRLNFDLDFPYRFLKAIHAGGAGGRAASQP